MSVVIKAENLSKAYQIGEIGTGTLTRDLERYWARVRGKEDPFLKIGEENDRAVRGESNVVWGLKDLNFEIEQGDAAGIIGRNGAGKSTLLKILSRVTAPTTGSVKIKGRIASLLEVGTGFHPELSGRENIFLNGAILGMRKAEIKRKFDEIVDFSGVERYIDTPVKRYSSGMYVRLAFAVAAHLESEIMIVDEVLAVGDAEFQKKCLGKMGDVSAREGRTVLFVSHNMGAVKNLCTSGIFLDNGTIKMNDKVGPVIERYFQSQKSSFQKITKNSPREGSGDVLFAGVEILNNKYEPINSTATGEDLIFKFILDVRVKSRNIDIGFSIHDEEDNMHSVLYSSYQGKLYDLDIGEHTVYFKLSDNYLSNRTYIIRGLIKANNNISDLPTNPLYELPVEIGNFFNTNNFGHQSSKITFLLKGEWE